MSKHHVAILFASLGLLSALPAQALAIDIVHLYVDLQAPGGQPPDCAPSPQPPPLFDRLLPSSTEFILEMSVPGKDAAGGSIDMWPESEGACTAPSPVTNRQHYKFALAFSGTDADRVARATIPPLQVQTKYCFTLKITRGLDEAQGAIVASQTAAFVLDKKVDIVTACGRNDNVALGRTVSSAIAEALDARVANARSPRSGGLRVKATIVSEAKQAASDAIVAGIDFNELCKNQNAAEKERAQATALFNAAEKAAADARAILLGAPTPRLVATHPLKARLPLLVTGAPPNFEVRRFDAILDQDAAVISAAVAALKSINPELSEKLQAISNADVAGKPALRKAYLVAINALPAKTAVFAYQMPNAASLATLPLEKLFAKDKGTVVVPNLQLLKQQLLAYVPDDRADANAWLAALGAFEKADQESRTLQAAYQAKQQASATATAAFGEKIKTRMQAAEIRALITSAVAIKVDQQTTAPPQTTEGASRVSPEVGVMVAMPIYYSSGGWEPWLIPYAAVNLYLARVDRVVPFDRLVGSTFRQRFAFTAGVLLRRPEINGTNISMAFLDSGVVPLLAVGYRLSSFTKVSVGGFLFDYLNANPAIGDLRHGGAVWIGLSVDADVWSAVQGKAIP